MLTILLHSSKTMRAPEIGDRPFQEPALLKHAKQLSDYLKTLNSKDIAARMQLSQAKAAQTHELLQAWSDEKNLQRPAIDAFLGDIYSGLQVQTFDDADRAYANKHLLILSGLYGGLKALDSIHPYRLEMGYKLPKKEYSNLYVFWENAIAGLIPKTGTIINLSAVEYTKAVLPYVDNGVIAPKFMTVSEKTGEPTFVTVHAKIARGAFSHWMIKNRIDSVSELTKFNELGYSYNAAESTPEQPVYICKEFKGLGLSVRLT